MKIVVSGLPSRSLVYSLISILDIKDEPLVRMQRSAEPSAVVQIIGNIIDWLDPFKIAAIAFIAEFAREMAKDVYKNKTKILKALHLKTVKPLYNFITTIFTSKNSDNNTRIIVCLNIPDSHIEASLNLNLESEDYLAWQFANFIIRLERIEEQINILKQSNNSPSSFIQLISQTDGLIIIRYMDNVNLKNHEIKID